MTKTVLIVEDDASFSRVLARALSRRGYTVCTAANPDEAMAVAAREKPAGVVLDLNLEGASGLNLIRPLLVQLPACRIVVLTGYASIATAVEAVKRGATQYFAKPVELDAILGVFESKDSAAEAQHIPTGTPLSVDRLEWEHIQRVLLEHGGNISATARVLNMHRRTLQRKLGKRPVKA